jgi:galactokinase
MQKVQALFKRHFGHAPTHQTQAPGRVELLGNHTDYNEGLVMSLAVDRFIFMAASPRPDGRIELVSSAFPQKETFFLSHLEKNPAAPWADYVKGVLRQLQQRGVPFRGFNAAIHATLPLGAGLSSSGALEVATVLTVRKLWPFELSATTVRTPANRRAAAELAPLSAKEKLCLAQLCQRAENDFVGVRCGLLDQVSSLFGKAHHVIELDCQHLTVERTPLPGDIAIVILDSGVKHELATSEYNALRAHCEAAARALGLRSLRALDPERLAASRSRLSPRQYECALHVVSENQRVLFGGRALREGDLTQFGQYLYQSHESSRDVFKNSCAELDLLVDLARRQPGCLGARLTGGGFGGATINLVERARADQFIATMAQEYERRSGRRLTPLRCQVADGAR